MFDIVQAAYSSRIFYAVMCGIAVLVVVAFWRRRRLPFYVSMVLLFGLFLVFQPWRYIEAFQVPDNLPPWDNDTLDFLSIYRRVFFVFIAFSVAYLFGSFATIRRIRHHERIATNAGK
jgi:hypothetical protein